jgi:SpoVK/Ycf46/Vps4 family AAA+-type ATPase
VIHFDNSRFGRRTTITLSKQAVRDFKLKKSYSGKKESDSSGMSGTMQTPIKMHDEEFSAHNEFLQHIPNESIEQERLFYNKDLENDLDFYINLLGKSDETLINNKFIKGKIILMFEGIPGTGKTAFANQLAKHCLRDVIQVNWHTLQNSYIGQSEKNLKSILDGIDDISSKNDRVPVVIFNESEGFLSQRVNVRQHSDRMGNTMVSMVLEWLEKKGCFGIVIFTANHVDLIDKAFERRITKISFEMPDRETRTKIWEHLFKHYDLDVDQEQFTDYELTGAEVSKIIESYGLHKLAYNIDFEKPEVLHRLCGNAKWVDNRPRIGFRQ